MLNTILVICPAPRDERELKKLQKNRDYHFIFHDYSSENLEKLIYEDGHEEGKSDHMLDIIQDLVVKYQKEPLAGIISSDDYPGATIASIVAKALNLPAPHPEIVLLCQHKYYSRVAQNKHIPEAVPRFELLSSTSPTCSLPYPFFLKPVKSFFSCFAQPILNSKEFRTIKKTLPSSLFLSPFNQLLQTYTSFEYDACHWIAEELLEGLQGTVEGFVYDGEVSFMGIVDSIMYPETICFKRFEYPSSLPESVQKRIEAYASRCMQGLGFNNGMFNIEFFYHPLKDTIHIIEINPRMASQFADLYEKVDGTNSYEVLLSIATRNKPKIKKREGAFRLAASCVLREFKNKRVRKIPTPECIKEAHAWFPECRIEVFAQQGKKLSYELQDGKSYRYGLIHLGADDLAELELKLERCLKLLDFQFEND